MSHVSMTGLHIRSVRKDEVCVCDWGTCMSLSTDEGVWPGYVQTWMLGENTPVSSCSSPDDLVELPHIHSTFFYECSWLISSSLAWWIFFKCTCCFPQASMPTPSTQICCDAFSSSLNFHLVPVEPSSSFCCPRQCHVLTCEAWAGPRQMVSEAQSEDCGYRVICWMSAGGDLHLPRACIYYRCIAAVRESSVLAEGKVKFRESTQDYNALTWWETTSSVFLNLRLFCL